MMNEYYDKINSQTEKFINIHTLSPQVDNIVQYKKAIEQLKPEKYIKKEFTKQEPDKNSVYEELSGEAVRTVTSWKFWNLSSMRKQFIEDRIDDRFNDLHMAWEDEKRKHDERENEMEAKKNKFYLKKFEETKKSLQMALDGTGEYIEESANSCLLYTSPSHNAYLTRLSIQTYPATVSYLA